MWKAVPLEALALAGDCHPARAGQLRSSRRELLPSYWQNKVAKSESERVGDRIEVAVVTSGFERRASKVSAVKIERLLWIAVLLK